MHTYTDATGESWSLVVTVDTVRRVRQLVSVDLMDVVKGAKPGDPPSLLNRLAEDPVLLVDVLYAICKPQVEMRKLDAEAFAARLAGDAIDTATMELLGAIADFFPSPTRKLLLQLIEAGRAYHNKAVDITADRVRLGIAEMMETLGASSPSAPASSAPTPDPSPSGS